MKRIILYLIFISMIISGCAVNEENVIAKMKQELNKYKGYESVLEVAINLEEDKSIYKMKEKYIKDKSTIVEIIEPENEREITLEYIDDKIIINNAAIEQSITLNDFEELDKGFLLKDIYNNLENLKFAGEETIKDKNYYIFDYPIKDKNKFTYRKNVFIDKKTLEPFKLEILDDKENTRTIVVYKKIKYLP